MPLAPIVLLRQIAEGAWGKAPKNLFKKEKYKKIGKDK